MGEGEGKMTANVLSRIFTIEIGDTPTLMFEAQSMREAQELCHEQWLKDDLAEAKSDGAPLWDGKAKLRVRMARLDESFVTISVDAETYARSMTLLLEARGGAADRDLDGVELVNGGRVLEYKEPERLAFTFKWDDGGSEETEISIDLREVGGKTEMTFRQAAFETTESRDGHRGGWSESFDKLATYLEAA